MDQDPHSVVRALFDGFNDGDLDRAVSTVTEDFELVDLAMGLSLHGREGCRDWLQTFRTALPDARTEVQSILGSGDRIATEHVGRGTHSGPFVTQASTIPPTGRLVEIHIAEFYEFSEGKIRRLA